MFKCRPYRHHALVLVSVISFRVYLFGKGVLEQWYIQSFCSFFTSLWSGLSSNYEDKYQMRDFMRDFPKVFAYRCNNHIQVNHKAALRISGLSRVPCLPQSVICEQSWSWRNAAPMVKRIMWGRVVINSSFLCFPLISSRGFQICVNKR